MLHGINVSGRSPLSANGGAQGTTSQKLPTFSFTEAIKNLNLNSLNRVEISSEAAEDGFTDVNGLTEYDALLGYMEDHLEELCLMEIEETIEQYCGIANEMLLSDSDNEYCANTVWNAIGGDYSCDVISRLPLDQERWVNSVSQLTCEQWADSLSPLVRERNVERLASFEEQFYPYNFEWKSVCEQSLERVVPIFDSNNRCYKEGDSPDHKYMTDVPLSRIAVKPEEEKDDEFVGKRRLCRHFLKGRCNRGKSCDFLHDQSVFCSDDQKVFLGGLPSSITDKELHKALMDQGYAVLNKPKVLQGFSPQICLGTKKEAQAMIRKGKILLKGTLVDVRPYEAFAKESLRMGTEDEVRRSVFIGGLASSTTGWMIKERLKQLGFETVNHPVVKCGFAPQVILSSVKQARKLVKMKKIKINKNTADVRQYSRYRSRS